jgi:asparagine synthase (glutamine-hydrolysing)
MCGIAGIVSQEQRLMDGDVENMVGSLGHRGPDARCHRTFGRCSLGHTRLRIIDLSPLGDQPLANEDDTVWTVFNGEIYNFGELRAQLAAAGHRFRSETDTEVLVHLYEEHGDDMVRLLCGMFAFAIWDDRRQRLLLCRDRLGIKPLYYRLEGPTLSFASEVQALSRPADTIDLSAVRAFLRLGWIPGPRTIRAGISELLPGHVLVWEAACANITRYWSPTATAQHAPTAEEAAQVLLDSIRRHLVADVPVGLFLSAGVDSVVVAELARRVAPDLRTYTVAFETAADESADAAAIAARLGLHHEVVPVGHVEAQTSVGRFIDDMDQPTVDGLNSWVISRAVREAGPVVALSGLGGDELFCGYSTFRHVPRLARASGGARVLGHLPGALANALDHSRRTAHSRARRAIEGVAAGGWGNAYASVRALFGDTELNRIWPSGRDVADNLIAVPPNGDRPGVAVVGGLELANYLPFQLLRDTDCMSMAHALEVRVPLLDDGVVDLALRGQAAEGAGWTKHRLVEAVDPGLRYLVDLPKRTFTLPIADWMRGGLSGIVEDAIVSVDEAGLGFDPRALTNLWHDYLGGHVGWRSVWGIAVLGMWLDCHTSGRVTAARIRVS